MNTLQLLKHGAGLTLDGYRQLAFINTFLKPLVNAHCIRTGYQLTPSEKKKVLFYYPMYTILGCAEMYTTLKGRGLTRDERKRLTLVAAWATLCDDLVDDHNWTRDEVFDLIFNKPKEEDLPGNVKLLAALNNEFLKIGKVSDKYLNQLKVALEWQSMSSKQLDPGITLEEIVTICREKNGNTSLMFAALIDEEWTEKERAFIYQSAIVGQLTNDAFDMYFDTQNGIHTYFNTALSIAQVRQFFLDECTKLHAIVMGCDTSRKNKLNTIRRMSILHAFTLTALDQFQQTEDKYGKSIEWKDIPRKDLVIDMALNKNRFKTIKYMKWLSNIIPSAEELKKLLNTSSIKRHRVKSSAIRSVGYDEDKQVVEVELMETGRIYKYFDVSLEEYLSLIEANSIGGYYNTIFKDKFPHYQEVT